MPGLTAHTDFSRRSHALRGLLFLALLAGLGSHSVVIAQAPGDDLRLLPSKERTFRIPFQTQPGENRIREVQLYYSLDQGRTWKHYATSTPQQGYFQQFTAPNDGTYWFTVRTVDFQNQPFPRTEAEMRPGLKVLVDTVPPSVALYSLPAQGNGVGVEWEVRDENLDLNTLRLEYLPSGGSQWVPVRVDLAGKGQHYFTPLTNGPLEVRLSVADLAGNVGQNKLVVTPGAANTVAQPRPDPNAGVQQPQQQQQPLGQNPSVRMVNSKRISLNYKIDDVGPSGVSVVELWYTQDGKSWQKYTEDAMGKPPLVFDVSAEGLYGFTLVVRSGVGLGDRPPQVNDPPQIWVEVDTTKPVVHLQTAEVGRGADADKLTIAWTATDKNMAATPITISYSEQADGPWTPIVANLENSGRYMWRMPRAGLPFKFLVKVEAIDKAGNVGSVQTPQPVIVDLAKPRPVILDVGVHSPR